MRILILPLFFAATAANAQSSGNGFDFVVGLGVSSTPDYFGSDNNSVGPTGSFSPSSATFQQFSFGQGDDAGGFGFRGSLRYISERTASDNRELAGLDDIDAALEIGGGIGYAAQNAEVFLVGRYGAIGHESFVGELGGDLIFQPNARTELRIGPRLFYGDDDYAATYFGVPSATGSFGAFDAKGGILSRGIDASIAYDMTENWGIVGEITYEELLNDAARSPIVQTTDQLGVSVVLTRKLSWSF